MIDLHTHSKFSDGTDSPAELAQKAHKVGISALALTDHDTTLSYDEIHEALAHYDIEHVPGVEISLRDDLFPTTQHGEAAQRNVHVLAYFLPIDPASAVQQKLALLRHDRDIRNRKLVEILQEFGFTKVTIEYLSELSGNVDSIGRPHFARAMIDLHPDLVGPLDDETWGRIFRDWLGSTGRAYLPKTAMTISEFVDAARGTGTVFSIAHPLLNYLDEPTPVSIEREMPRVMASLRERGFSGVEAYYGSTPEPIRQLMVKLTRDAGLIPTGGSDYHGQVKEDVSLGLGRTGDLHVPDVILDELKAEQQRLRQSFPA